MQLLPVSEDYLLLDGGLQVGWYKFSVLQLLGI